MATAPKNYLGEEEIEKARREFADSFFEQTGGNLFDRVEAITEAVVAPVRDFITIPECQNGMHVRILLVGFFAGVLTMVLALSFAKMLF